MIRHNIKQSVRGMLKNKTFTFLNLAGFAVGFAVCIIIMIFAYKEYETDSCYPNAENIYRLVDSKTKSSSIDSNIAEQLKVFSDVEQSVSVFYADFKSEDSHEFLLDVATGNNVETLNPFIVTTNKFFPMFGIKTLVSKTDVPFADVKSIVLTKSVAMRLFGKIDVLDKVIKKEDAFFTVSAVVEDMPENSSFNGDFFVHINHPDYEIAIGNNKAGRFRPHDVYVLLNKDTDVAKFTSELNASFPKNKSLTESVFLQPLRDIYLDTDVLNYNKSGNKKLIWIFITIAVLTLIMSIFNYANFMISRQMATLKNSGIHITNGALRKQIRAYYFTEVSLAVFVAFVAALLIAELAMPYTERLLDTKLGLHWLLEPKLFAIFTILFMAVVFFSAIAPIAFISRMKVQTLFGKTNIKSRKHPIKRVMNITQLAISMVLLVAVFVVNKQLNFVKTKDIGFQTSHLLRLNIPWDFKNYNVAKLEYSKLPFVEHSSLTSHTPGSGWWRMNLKNKEGKEIDFQVIKVDEDFLKTFGMKLQKGRVFRKTDLNKNRHYLSEYGYKLLGWDNLEDIKLRNKEDKVVGVINNLYFNSLHSKLKPIVFLYKDSFYSGLNLKLSRGNLAEQMKIIEKLWKKVFGNEPFSFSFYDQYFDSLYKKEERQSKALTLFVIIAFIITCMGLLSQVLQNTQNRIKEIGIRKINGATIKEVMLLLNKEFVWTVIIAFVIATPVAYYAMTKWLESFAYKTALSWWIFALAGVAALLIALLTVSWQSYRAASRNPVEALRYE